MKVPNPLVIVHHRLNNVGPNELKLFAGSLAAAVDPKLSMGLNLMVVPSIRSVFVAWREHMILEFGAYKHQPDQSVHNHDMAVKDALN